MLGLKLTMLVKGATGVLTLNIASTSADKSWLQSKVKYVLVHFPQDIMISDHIFLPDDIIPHGRWNLRC